MVEKAEKEYFIQGSEGKIRMVFRLPERVEGAVPLAILMHGFMSDMDQPLLLRLADELHSRGMATLRFDFNGHGRSDGFVHKSTLESEVEDAKRAYRFAKTLCNIGPVCLCGHSQGGVVAAILATEPDFDKVGCIVELSPSVAFRKESETGRLLGREYDPDHLEDSLVPFFHHVSRRTYSVAMAVPMLRRCFEYDGRVCLIQGTEDEVVPFCFSEWSLSLYRNCERHMIEGERHAFDLRPEETVSLISDFIERNINN